MFQLVWCVLCTLYHLSRYDVLDSYPPISHVPIPALCAASKGLVIRSCAGLFIWNWIWDLGLFWQVGQFQVCDFFVFFKKIMDSIYFRLIKEGNNCLSKYRYILENLQFFESQFYAGTSWGMIWAPGSNLDLTVMAFCYQNCSDLLWEKIVIVIEKNFWNSRLKAKN